MVVEVKVAWREGYLHRGVRPEDAYEVVKALEREKGEVRPRDLVEAARDPQNPIHPLITWDDQVAAQRWREHEAQELIRALEVKVLVPEVKEPVRVRAYHSTGRGAYEHLSAVQTSRSKRERVMESAVRELEAIQEKVKALTLVLGSPYYTEPVLNGVDESIRRIREG